MTTEPFTQSQIVNQTADHVRTLAASDTSGHDWWHVDRVRRMALYIARREEADLFVVELAALVHDIADWKFHGGDETLGPKVAAEWLDNLGVDSSVIEHVSQIVRDISFKGAGVATPMRTLEGSAVQDSDRLDAIGAIGIARAFAYGGHAGQPMHDPRIEVEMHTSFEIYKKAGGTTINHFHEKLLLLKDRMTTPTGRRLAEARHVFMERFLKQFQSEWRGES